MWARLIAPIAKALVAMIVPFALPWLHWAGLTEVSPTGLETALTAGIGAGVTLGMTYLVPNTPKPAAE